MSDHSLPAFVDALGDGVYGVDLDGRCLFVNASALRILGYDRKDELVGRNMHEAIHHTRLDGSVLPQAECPLLQTARSGQAVRLENELLWRRDGTSFFAEYSAFPVGEEGSITGSVVTFTASRARQDARIRLAVQHAVSQVLAGTTGRDRMMEQVLSTVGSGFGWDVGLFWRQDGTTANGLRLAARWEAPDAGSVGSFARSSEAQVLDGSAGLGGRAWSMQQPVHAADMADEADPRLLIASGHGLRSGFAFPVVAGATAYGAMEFYDRNRIEVDTVLLEAVTVIGQMVGQALDRQRVTRDMRKSEARFRTIANAVPQLAWMTGPDGAINWYNDRWYAFTGTTPQQMEGWGWMTVHHPEHLDRVLRNLRESFAVGSDWEDTFPLRAADGSYRWFLSRAMPIRVAVEEHHDGEGDILGWFGTNTDITAIRAAEQSQTEALDEAEAANQAKSLFLANMSHELRTPLSAIIGYAEMLVEEVEDGAEREEVVRDIRKVETNARHLLGLINDVLDLSKVESGKMEAFAETFGVEAMMRDVAATVGSLVAKKGNRLVLEVAGELGTMHSDVTRIRQVLLNLLSNAAKFTEHGVITLSAGRGPDLDGADWLSFAISDTGLGMSEEQLAKLFQRFQQADASTTRNYGGTGLGLSLTRAFSELLGGTVEVRSQPGEGSTFTMRIPAKLPSAAPELEPEVVSMADPDRQVVLVIDDDPIQRDLMSRFLERTGYTARTAADGATGLALAGSLHPHAILLDVTMPGMDGWSVLTALKADPELTDIPVVMVTLVDERALASSLGAADYLRKPVDWSRLGLVMDRFRAAEGDVLLVDDDADARQRLRQALEKNGWSVAEAVDGQDALDQVRQALPRLILLDLAMPTMDGFEFLRELRQQPGCGTVPVVVLTVLDLTMEDRRKLRGASQVLNKGSISLNELTEKLRQIESLAPRTDARD